ncbi:MAG: leucyl aminopeptidase [Mycoplasmoidaceae bacterium]
MLINKKNLLETLHAITVDSKKNDKNKNYFEILKKDKSIYFIMPKRLEVSMMTDFSLALRSFFKTNKNAININLDSFLQFSNKNILKTEIIEILLWWVKFFEKEPYNLKTKNIVEKEHNLIYKSECKNLIDQILPILEAQEFCRILQDTPSREMTPIIFEKKVKELFANFEKKVEINVFNKEKLESKGMGLLLGVNKASCEEPRLISIKYLGSKKSKDLIAYIGKGITFDMGGSNLKTGSAMRWMKFDMSGAAIVMSTLYALVKNNADVNVVAIAALTDNAINEKGIRPDDILKSYNGMTVEIDNTDAEGRLVLADAITFAIRDLKVSKIVDIATLTGAMIFALGETFTGVWATNENDWLTFKKAADYAGENVWRLPFHRDFLNMLKSPIADIKNSCNDRRAGSSRAAAFLKEFTEDLNYIHLDIAATADVDNRGQAVMIKTLYRYAYENK